MTMDLEGTILVTGAAGGIGTGWIHEHLKSPQALTHYTIFVIHPSAPGQLKQILEKEAPEECKYEIVELDLSSQVAIKNYITTLKSRIEKKEIPMIRLLLLIAGAMFLDPVASGGVGFTSEGLEKSFAVNYVANVLLILNLMGSMDERGARILWLASTSHDPNLLSSSGAFPKPEMRIILKGDGAEVGDVERLAKATDKISKGDEFPAAIRRYGASKFCMTMFTYALHRRLSSPTSPFPNIQILANSPGCVGGTTLTSSMPWYIRLVMQYVLIPLQALSVMIWRNGSLRTAKVAGEDLMWCCWDESLKGGEYVDGRVVSVSSEESLDVGKQEVVWKGTGELLGLGAEMGVLGDGC
ncbi:hypothetical protein BDZ45DRAFT_720691 [Acephala macrosclerotiorum]|nr:hypothetical protein BDZ45DRAFT_720691 [Acephala macrosclerotiorum]